MRFKLESVNTSAELKGHAGIELVGTNMDKNVPKTEFIFANNEGLVNKANSLNTGDVIELKYAKNKKGFMNLVEINAKDPGPKAPFVPGKSGGGFDNNGARVGGMAHDVVKLACQIATAEGRSVNGTDLSKSIEMVKSVFSQLENKPSGTTTTSSTTTTTDASEDLPF